MGLGPEGARTRRGGRLFWGRHRAPRGLGVLVGDPGSSPQALSSLSRETCLLPPPKPECGLFILGLSCRHSSTFSAAVAAPPPPASLGLHPSRRPGGGGGRWGDFSSLPSLASLPCPSPLASVLTACLSCLTVHSSASASLLTPHPWLWRQTPGEKAVFHPASYITLGKPRYFS